MAAAAHASAAASTGGGSIRVLHRRFVLALLLEGHTNDDVRAVLEREDLDEVDDASLNRMRSELSPPKRFSARSRKHRASVEYLDGLGVSALIHHEPDAEDALRLLRLPKARDVAECGLVLRVPLEAIVVQLRHQGVTATPKAIERFEEWFWCVSGFDRSTLRVILEVRAVRRALRRISSDDERAAALRAARSDPRVLAASLPTTALSWHITLGALGHAPATLAVDKVLEHVRSHAALRAAESAMRGGPGDEARGTAFISILRAAHELHQQVVPADAVLRDGLSTLRLGTDASQVPTIAPISDGRHTVDLQPRAEADQSDVPPDAVEEEGTEIDFPS